MKQMVFVNRVYTVFLAYPTIMTLRFSWTLQYFIIDCLAKTTLVPFSGFF